MLKKPWQRFVRKSRSSGSSGTGETPAVSGDGTGGFSSCSMVAIGLKVNLAEERETPGVTDKGLKSRVSFLSTLAVDCWVISLTYVAAWALVAFAIRIPGQFLPHSPLLFFVTVILVTTLYLRGAYKPVWRRRPERELEMMVKSVLLSFPLGLLLHYLSLKQVGLSRYMLLTWWLLLLVSLPLARFLVREAYEALWRAGRLQGRVVFIGSEDAYREVYDHLRLQRCPHYNFVAVISEDLSRVRFAGESEQTGPLENWAEWVRKDDIDLVVLGFEHYNEQAHHTVAKIAQQCRLVQVPLRVHSEVLRSSVFDQEADDLWDSFLFLPKRNALHEPLYVFLKRLIDIMIGVTGSIITLIIAPIIGLLIWLEDRGPIFHEREFVGSDGKLHYYRKFRSMKVGADRMLEQDAELKAQFHANYKLENDPRVTRLGRFLRKYSLDEFPQFFTLLGGNLSFIGPRVISWAERERYGPLLRKLLSVKPGMAGYWQLTGRQCTTYEERIRMDMFYIERWSIWMDIYLILKSFWKVISATGAY
jgi:exopolysaccharide biosynthesis polyprenyl glycosylphosphotransferase